jgi:tetratricopeptide (TPR) repeat protein
MPDDRRSRPGRPGKPPAGRNQSGRPGRPGRPSGGGQRDASRGGSGRGRPASGARDGGRDGGRGGSRRPPAGRRDARVEREEPRTEAERRAAEVRATRGPRRTPRTEEGERAKIEQRTTEQWIDEGSIRAEATAATARAAGGRTRRPAEIDPEVVAQIHDALDPQRAARLSERLASAAAALDRERFEEARRMVTPLARELPHVAAVHEVAGLASYRLGKWKQAAQSLELARQLHPDPSLLPVLADCYRAQRRWTDVDSVWRDVKAASPAHDVMAEARIVVAGSLADRGDVKAAIALLEPATKPPKRVREHHLRQWYVLADLYDRAGDTMSAARWFREIAVRDGEFADVRDRLRALGR